MSDSTISRAELTAEELAYFESMAAVVPEIHRLIAAYQGVVESRAYGRDINNDLQLEQDLLCSVLQDVKKVVEDCDPHAEDASLRQTLATVLDMVDSEQLPIGKAPAALGIVNLSAVPFAEQNDLLKAAPGTEHYVNDLPIFRQGMSFGVDGRRYDPCVISVWQIPMEARMQVAKTGLLYFRCEGQTHPPISAYATCPFTPLAVRTCRHCGCTDDDCSQCIAKTGHPCHWVRADECSACVHTTDK